MEKIKTLLIQSKKDPNFNSDGLLTKGLEQFRDENIFLWKMFHMRGALISRFR